MLRTTEPTLQPCNYVSKNKGKTKGQVRDRALALGSVPRPWGGRGVNPFITLPAKIQGSLTTPLTGREERARMRPEREDSFFTRPVFIVWNAV